MITYWIDRSRAGEGVLAQFSMQTIDYIGKNRPLLLGKDVGQK